MGKIKIDYTSEDYWHKLINQSLIRFFILRALKDRDLHGYLLIQEIRRQSNDFCNPTESTLYPALNQMAKAGLVQLTDTKDRTRKTYRLTPKGKDGFRVAAKVWNNILPTLLKKTIL